MTLPTTIEETEAWLERPLTDNERALFDFCEPVYRAAQDEKVLRYNAWFECPAEFLLTPIPQEALNAFYGVSVDDEGNETPNVSGLILADFTFSVEPRIDGSKALCRAGAKHGATYRKERVTADDLKDWLTSLQSFGLTIADLLNIQAYRELKESPVYKTGEE